MTEAVSIAVVYHSATGRTRSLAESVVRGALAVDGTSAQLLSVEDAATPSGQAALSMASAIVFGSPTYMGSASAQFKAFMDSTSAIWALQGWRDKLAAGFTHSAAPSGDKLGTLMQLAVFAAQHGMVWVGLGLPPTYAGLDPGVDDTNRLGSHLGAMAQSRPGGGAKVPGSDLATAELLGKRIAQAALRWRVAPPIPRSSRSLPDADAPQRHFATRGWTFPSSSRAAPTDDVQRINLKEIVARPDRFEHHLIVAASVDDVRFEITTASEPLYFAHINVSDEYAVALPSGDELVDRFPLRTFLTDPAHAQDVGRYNHRVGDLVLHPENLMHWPGRLREPYEPFDFPPGMRRCGLSLVYCASKPTPATWCPMPIPPGREGDAKAYVAPPPPMVLASLRGHPGTIARIGRTTLSLVELPELIEPAYGGWVVVLEAVPGSPHAACDLIRIPGAGSLDGRGITRALVLTSEAVAPDPPPPSWTAFPPPPFAPYEDASPGELPFEANGLQVAEASPALAALSIKGVTVQTPRYWLARTLFRIALHDVRIGYVETYNGVFFDDREGDLVVGLRGERERVSVKFERADALAFIETLYRAVAPAGYREPPT
jgi:NAD(P)H dehydrogenase (quinone)